MLLKSITADYAENDNVDYEIGGITVGEDMIYPDLYKEGDDAGKPATITVTLKYKDGISSILNITDVNARLVFEFTKIKSVLAKVNQATTGFLINHFRKRTLEK